MPKLPSKDDNQTHAEPPAEPTAPTTPHLTPLALILQVMHNRFDGGDHDAAVALARIAAPYLHPRIPATTPAADLAAMPDADLDTVRPQD